MLKTHSFKDVFFISNKTIHKTNSINKVLDIAMQLIIMKV